MTPSRWYVKSRTGLEGPLADDELRAGLKSGRFTWLDLAYETAEGRWRALIEIEFLGELRHPAVKPEAALWVIHHRKGSEEAPKARYSGPLDTETINKLIKAGEISYDDDICAYGEKNWRRVGDCAEFAAPRAYEDFTLSKTEDLLELPQITLNIDEVMKSVTRVQCETVKQTPLDEEPPPEADGEDLVGMPEWMKFIGIFVLFMLGSFSAQAADVLKIVPLKLQTSPTLVFEADTGKLVKIDVRIIGENGAVLGVPSFRYNTEVKVRKGELPSLSLSSLGLPEGTYRIEARAGRAKATETVVIGNRDGQLEARLEEYRKAIAADTQTEKRTLFYSAKAHERLASELASALERSRSKPAQWRKFYSAWKTRFNAVREPVRQLAERAVKKNAVAYPEAVEKLKATSDELEKVAQDVDAAVKGGRQPASAPQTKSLVESFRVLKLTAGQL